jgi:23S rRNA U2552 (ribose-2'-O)-methylase RlmE/FtsJ
MLATEVPLSKAVIRKREDFDAEEENYKRFDHLAELKRKIPGIRSRMEDKWIINTRCYTTLSPVSKPINRAYGKLHEILLSCGFQDSRFSIHFCEAPGSFVQCTGDIIAVSGWEWIATSKGEIPFSPSLKGGTTITSDILLESRKTFWGLPENAIGRADFATADGAFEMNHDNIEAEHLRLFTSECMACVDVLKDGGCCVVKFFEGMDSRTLLVIAWMTNVFEQVSVIKPKQSRPTNSERYLVCKNKGKVAVELGNGIVATTFWKEEAFQVMKRFVIQQEDSLQAAIVRTEGSS